MGAERWLQFKSVEEADRVNKFLSPLGGEISSNQDSCGLHWAHPCELEVSYSFGGDCDDVLATFVCREIARRFAVTKIGADSVGWYSENDWTNPDPKGATARYGAYTNWADWMKDYKPEWSPDVRFEPESIEDVRRIEAAVVAIFENLEVPE